MSEATPAIKIIKDRIAKLTEKAHKRYEKKCRFARWFLHDGDFDYCPNCIVKEQKRRIKENQGIPERLHQETVIDGWDDYHESDSPRTCEKCKRILFCSLSKFAAREEIESNEFDDIGLYFIHELVTGMGDLEGVEEWEEKLLDLYLRLKWHSELTPIDAKELAR